MRLNQEMGLVETKDNVDEPTQTADKNGLYRVAEETRKNDLEMVEQQMDGMRNGMKVEEECGGDVVVGVMVVVRNEMIRKGDRKLKCQKW